MAVVGIIALPCVLMGLVFYLRIKAAYRSCSPARPLLLYPLICFAIITGGYMVWGYHAILTSRSSTAAIGFVFLPFYAAALAIVAFVVSWSVLYVGWFIFQRVQGKPVRSTSVTILTSAVVLLGWAGYVAQVKIARHRLLDEAESGYNVDRLDIILTEGVSSQDFDVLANLAKNPSTPANDLALLYDFCKPRISQLGGSESSILLPLARNPHTPPEVLTFLATSRQSWIRDSVVRNPSTPISTLRQLTADQDETVKGQAKGELRLREQGRKPDTE
jgi:hypothetical protein